MFEVLAQKKVTQKLARFLLRLLASLQLNDSCMHSCRADLRQLPDPFERVVTRCKIVERGYKDGQDTYARSGRDIFTFSRIISGR